MGKMSLKAGDNIIVYFYPDGADQWHEYVTVKGFTAYGIHFEEAWLHFSTERNWYGFGYHNNGYVIYVRYAWQMPYAYVFEKVRLKDYFGIVFYQRKVAWKRRDISDLMVLKAYEQFRATNFKGKFPYDLIIRMTGAPFKVVWRAIERTHDRGYLDYGTSLRTAWITDRGKQFISSQ